MRRRYFILDAALFRLVAVRLFDMSLMAALLIGAPGCAGEPVYPRRMHSLSPVAAQQLPICGEIPRAATSARWGADASRLAVDVERAVERIHWALLELLPASGDLPLRAHALLPDNRTAAIYAWALNEREVAAAIQIGRFGDPQAEHAFLQMLADTLADKPRPSRGGTFELP